MMIHDVVKERYGRIAESFQAEEKAACCDDSCCSPTGSLYDADLSALPHDVTGLSLGCGDPLTMATLQPGEVVLDLGSGGGIDCFLAARNVGPTGRVIGVDMTPAMIARAEANQTKVDLPNVEFRLGHIEDLPVEDDSVDVVISNCVVNLSPDKQAVFREAFRVLRPGGRLAVADMVTLGAQAEALRSDADAWAECIAGAEEVSDYVAAVAAAGFTDISLQDKGAPEVELAHAVPLPGAPPRLFSARLTAVKPVA